MPTIKQARDHLGVLVYPGSDQSIPTATEVAVLMGSAAWDTGVMRSNAGSDGRIALPRGRWAVQATLIWASHSASTLRAVSLRDQNGTNLSRMQVPSAPNHYSGGHVGAIVESDGTRKVGLIAYQESGASLTVIASITNLSAHYLGPQR